MNSLLQVTRSATLRVSTLGNPVTTSLSSRWLVTPSQSFNSLKNLAEGNSRLGESLEHFDSNDIPRALEIAVEEYRVELQSYDTRNILTNSKASDESARPAFAFLSSLLASLGPKHPETIKTLGLMRSTHPEATPFKIRKIQKSHGGYPVRLNNGKWTWQGPHWSRHNNRTWKTGYSSDFTYGWGK